MELIQTHSDIPLWQPAVAPTLHISSAPTIGIIEFIQRNWLGILILGSILTVGFIFFFTNKKLKVAKQYKEKLTLHYPISLNPFYMAENTFHLPFSVKGK